MLKKNFSCLEIYEGHMVDIECIHPEFKDYFIEMFEMNELINNNGLETEKDPNRKQRYEIENHLADKALISLNTPGPSVIKMHTIFLDTYINIIEIYQDIHSNRTSANSIRIQLGLEKISTNGCTVRYLFARALMDEALEFKAKYYKITKYYNALSLKDRKILMKGLAAVI